MGVPIRPPLTTTAAKLAVMGRTAMDGVVRKCWLVAAYAQRLARQDACVIGRRRAARREWARIDCSCGLNHQETSR